MQFRTTCLEKGSAQCGLSSPTAINNQDKLPGHDLGPAWSRDSSFKIPFLGNPKSCQVDQPKLTATVCKQGNTYLSHRRSQKNVRSGCVPSFSQKVSEECKIWVCSSFSTDTSHFQPSFHFLRKEKERKIKREIKKRIKESINCFSNNSCLEIKKTCLSAWEADSAHSTWFLMAIPCLYYFTVLTQNLNESLSSFQSILTGHLAPW